MKYKLQMLQSGVSLPRAPGVTTITTQQSQDYITGMR